jgi:hypothetical protein
MSVILEICYTEHTHTRIRVYLGKIATETERARRFLETYFSRNVDLDIYWGSVADFCRRLVQHWEAL